MKLRRPGSHEDAIIQSAAILGWEGAAAAIGKSVSLLRQASDPDCELHRLQAKQMLALDIACKQEAGSTPFFDWYSWRVGETDFTGGHVDLSNASLDAMASLGKLSECIRAAKSPTGPGGHRITRGEQDSLNKAIKHMRGVLDKMQGAVIAVDNSNVHTLAGE